MTQETNTHRTLELQEKIYTYRDMLYKLALVQLKSSQDAEDVVQDVFYRYYRTAPKFEGNEHERAWLIRVTLNECRKVWRSAWYRHRAAFPDSEPMTESRLERDYLQKERQERILKAVLSLSPRYREVIHLFYYEDMSIREICQVTGRKESTVTSQLTRGRELLRKKLKEEVDFE